MRCSRCGNEDLAYFYLDGTTWYCRKCIAFGRVDVGKGVEAKTYRKRKIDCSYSLKYSLKYPLTPLQKQAVSKIMSFLKQKKDVLVYAACGFRVIIVTVANSLGNIRVFELLPKLKTEKLSGWCTA